MLKQALLVVGALSLATTASALESTNPFFGPAKGSIASTTSYDFATTTTKGEGTRTKDYTHKIAQTLQYGLTDSVSLDATVSNAWNKTKLAVGVVDTDDKNIDFEIGSTWNVLTGKTKVQVSGAYGQKESNSHDNYGAYKYAKIGAKAGYTMGVYTPYIAGHTEIPVAQNKDGDNHVKYEGKVGLYTYCPKMKWALDTALRTNYDETTEMDAYSVDVEASYFITKNWAVSAYGSYVLDGESKGNTDIYGNKIGLRLRTAF